MQLIKRIIGFFFFLYYCIFFIPVTAIFALIVLIASALGIRYDKFYRLMARLWGKTGQWLAFSPVKVLHPEKAKTKEGCGVIISNHQSGFDILAGLGYYPVDFLFMSKKEMFKIPLVGPAMKRLGYISVDRQNPKRAAKSLEEAIAKIRQGYYVLIYPEGTRSQNPRQMLPFKAGTIKVAREGKIPLVPIVLYGTQEINNPWIKMCLLPHKVIISVMDPIYADNPLHPANEQSKYSDKERLEKLRELMMEEYDRLAPPKN
ncbi:MAG: 1-acyl-sn-glycerol-3-phosphate acyltransferase [Candidatus Hydrogenedentota bacterium]|nr:MAG: 1-acyl-sn-glycerol-3-phosphate acyltransferase [Candidatus Hydrogenedentota bacterium]